MLTILAVHTDDPLLIGYVRRVEQPGFPYSAQADVLAQDAMLMRQCQPSRVPCLRPIRSGSFYRLVGSRRRRLVAPILARALEAVFEKLGKAVAAHADNPLEISIARGFDGDSRGHCSGRAADIDSVGGKGLLDWNREWNGAFAAANALDDKNECNDAMRREELGNLGHQLYAALRHHGGWLVNPSGYRPYRNVEQLFGPWTASEGPWKAIKAPAATTRELQRLRDQRWVFSAHQDHIHVAR
jgi:hypothetical protein